MLHCKPPFQHSRIGWIIGGLAIAFGFAFLFGFFVMLLWNWLMPTIFGLGTIGYWQAWGLLLLAHLLFKAGHGNHAKPGHTHDEYWREKFHKRMHDRFHGTETPEETSPENKQE